MRDTGAFERTDEGFVLHLGPDERAMLARLFDELRNLLMKPDEASSEAMVRLFPVVHPDDTEDEAEYQRLMRDELVASRLAGISAIEQVIGRGEPGPGAPVAVFDEERLVAFMQAVNSVRLVLGTLLEVSEDDTIADDTGALAPEHHLYAYLSWVLDSAVAVMAPDYDEDDDWGS